MPVIGLILGLILAAWISVFTLFNDAYLQQPLMTGNLMPTSVYGPAVLLVLLCGGTVWRRAARRQIVGRRDLAVMVILATAACAWPGTNFLRTFVGSTGNVANLAKTQDHWRTADVLSYTPDGLLLNDGRDRPGVTDTLVLGADDPDDFALGNVPWSDWWPVLRVWGGLALLLGLASVCVGLIVHPQWSRYEKLPYPLVRFLEELTKPREDQTLRSPSLAQRRRGGLGGPAVLSNKLFWLGVVGVAGIHGVNGLFKWNSAREGNFIPLTYDFTPLIQLFPSAANVFGGTEQFKPTIYFSVVAFVFFIRGDVSFSVGVSNLVWVVLGAVFLARGESLGNLPIETHEGTLLRAGAYLGFAAMILYLGRRHYGRVAAAALWLRRDDPELRSGAWAFRGLVICLAAAVWLLARYANLDWRLGVIVVGLIMVILLILARLSAETGMFYLEPNWMPLVVVSAMLGFEGMGPTAFVTVALVSTILVGAPREPLLGYVVNGLQLAERFTPRPRKPRNLERAKGDDSPGQGESFRGGVGAMGWGMAAVATASLGLAVVATLVLSHTRGLSPFDPWGTRWHAALPFDALARRVSDLASSGRLQEVVAAADAGHFAAAVPDAGALGWLFVGVALVVGCALARLRVAWWPIHPVLFLVLGSSPAVRVGWSFLIGWAIRQAVVRLGGVKAFHATLPLAVGAIAGELLAALGWQTCGIGYYFLTGDQPSRFFILPN